MRKTLKHTLTLLTALLPLSRAAVCAMEWWNTAQVRCLKRERLKARGDAPVLSLPDLETDIACKIKHPSEHD